MAHCRAVQLALLAACLALAGAQSADYLGAQCVGATCDNGLPCLTLDGDECPLEAWTFEQPHPCTCGGTGGESDPYFTGFYGQGFYFPAEANRTYNIFSEQSHLVNAHFVATELPEASDLTARLSGAANSSFIGAISLRHDYSLVEVSADRKGNIAVSINGQPLPLGEELVDINLQMLLGVGVELTVRKYQLPWMNEVHLETELLSLSITPEMEHTDNLGSTVRGHLSLQLNLKSEAWAGRVAHGVLGQTADPTVDTEVADAFPGDGSAADYEVSSLAAHDFPFNLYSQDADLDPSRLQDIRRIASAAVSQGSGSGSTAKPAVAISRRLLAGKQEAQKLLAAGVNSQWAAYPRDSSSR